MLAVGIPTYNEVDNISRLVKSIDQAAVRLKLDIIIVNSDNNSPDGTSELFSPTHTMCSKVALTAARAGKGRNIREIVKYVSKNTEIDSCMLIDGDITSFEQEWLEKYSHSMNNGSDYVVPNYARKIYESNTTNHFVYPLLNSLTKGKSPAQPIAGDFGLSRRFCEYLSNIVWSNSAKGYGVDIFLTMHALLNGFSVEEIYLNKKIHKPSFDKMVGMFQEVAESYYDFLTIDRLSQPVKFEGSVIKTRFLAADPIPENVIHQRINLAKNLYNQKNHRRTSDKWPLDNMLNSRKWSIIIKSHKQLIGNIPSHEIARSILPFYLIRVATYLKKIQTINDAKTEINQQVKIIDEALTNTRN